VGVERRGEMEGAHIASFFAKTRHFLKVPQNLQKYVYVCARARACIGECVRAK